MMGLKILSCYDGMACGMIAMLNAGMEIDRYVAYEIDKYAVQTATHNFPTIEEKGDVFNADFTEYQGFDIVMAGFPCTKFSIAQSKDREVRPYSGIGWELFEQAWRAVEESKPKFFLFENNKSMAKPIKAEISRIVGFDPVEINSALVSAQNRQRYYWVGRRNKDGAYSKVDVQQPEDRGILLKDVLDGAGAKELTDREMKYMVRQSSDGRNHFDFGYIQDAAKEKGKCITANISKGVPYNVCCEPIRCGTYPGSKCPECDSKQYRVYDTEGKAVTQCGQGGGLGAKTGLYAVPCDCQVTTNNVSYAVVCEWDDKGIPIKATSGADGKTYTVYPVVNGQITIKEKTYPIKLIDGYYIIRKLTVSECKRLQTVPEWYEFPVSNTQAYKMLGNGWTCDVITHLIQACFR